MNQNFFEPNSCYEPNSSSFDQYHSSQSSVTQQLPHRSNENIKLEIAKLIKTNRILLNDNVFPHEEASMEVFLAKERILKLIKAWDEKQIESWSFDDELLFNEDVPMEDFKDYSNPLFDNEEINSNKIDLHYFNAKSDLIKSLSSCDTLIDSSLKFDYLEEFSGALMPTSITDEESIRKEHEEYISLMEKLFTINSFPRPLKNFHANMIVETLPTFPILVEDSDSPREEIDIFTDTDDLVPPGIESDDFDLGGDIHIFEELLGNDTPPIPKNESSNFDHHDNPSFPRPPPEPPDVEIFFKPDLGVLTTNVVKGIFEHYVLMPNILPTLPTFDPLYPVYDNLLPFSSENEDKVFKPEIPSGEIKVHIEVVLWGNRLPIQTVRCHCLGGGWTNGRMTRGTVAAGKRFSTRPYRLGVVRSTTTLTPKVDYNLHWNIVREHVNRDKFKIQKVWILVDLPFRKKAIRTKWVYMNKKEEMGVVVRNKARLVSQGHMQEEGIDYDEVFALMARIEAIRIFLAFASYIGFIVYQMDVKSAFLYRKINKEVYVSQPPGFVDP
nr:putative ribonuclease H-like domain-containing protein [Tanacetum cinerariifolium]